METSPEQQQEVVRRTADHVKELFTGESTGHDWWHIYRVWQMAIHLAKQEHVDSFVVELGALLHDIADFKFHDGDETVGPKEARAWLEGLGVDAQTVERVCHIVANVSFKGAGVANGMESREGEIVQDADRLDALGAIGIARTFAYNGHKGNVMYDPGVKPVSHTSFEAYRNANGSAINHFYEKLLLIKDLMHTDAAKRIAERRHAAMETYLEEFYKEWEAKDV